MTPDEQKRKHSRWCSRHEKVHHPGRTYEECVFPNETRKWSVWVGGCESNDFYLTKKQAEERATYFNQLGYDDVQMRKERDVL